MTALDPGSPRDVSRPDTVQPDNVIAGDQPSSWEEVVAEGSPWHAHWSPVWRLDDETSRQLVVYCRDTRCAVAASEIGPQIDDTRFSCGYCPNTAVMTTVIPADGGKSAACFAHADQLTTAYLTDAVDRDHTRDDVRTHRLRRGE